MEIRLSASYIQDYLDCPAKAYFRRYHSKDVEDSPDLNVGTIVHDVAERHKTLESGLKYAESQYLGYNLTGKYVEKAEKCIRNFFSPDFQALITPEDKIENQFKIPLGNDVYLIGMIDRILPYGRLIDWKTNARSFSRHNIQSIIYTWAYRKLYKREPVDFVFAFLNPGDISVLKPDPRLEKVLFSEIIPHIINTIKRLGTYPRTGEYNGSCYMCGYKSLCKENELDS